MFNTFRRAPPTKIEIIFNGACQFLAIGLAVVFGVYTIFSSYAANAANQQALVANQLSLLQYCQNAQADPDCPSILQFLSQNLNLKDITSQLFPNAAAGIPPSTPTSTMSSSAFSTITSLPTAITTITIFPTNSAPGSLPPPIRTTIFGPSSFPSAFPTVTASATATATSFPSSIPNSGEAADPGQKGMSTSTKLALGVGLGVGVPCLALTVMSCLLTRQKLRRYKTEYEA